MQTKSEEYEAHVRSENRTRPPPIEDDLLRRDIYNYLCYTFWTYWRGGDLDEMLHPSSDTVSNFARVMVADSLGHTALDSMMDHIEMLRARGSETRDNLIPQAYRSQ
jgi:hypothetical protein